MTLFDCSPHTPTHFFFIMFCAFASRHSNNRIPPEGAVHLAMGLRINKTIKSLNVSYQKEIGSSLKSNGGHQWVKWDK